MDKRIEDLLKRKYDFQWEVLDIIVGGKSSIDTAQGFHINNIEEANNFILSYGYNLENSIEKAEVSGNFHESVNFIRRYFLQPDNPDGLQLEIPKKILELTDIRELFLMANFRHNAQNNNASYSAEIRNWACSILKIMHTIAHIDQDVRTSYFADVQQQIFDRYYKIIHRNTEGHLYLGENPEDPIGVKLVAFETKPKKSRDSTLLKLLHKPESVAEDIFDRVGLRFITETKLDVLRIIKYLKDKMIIMPPNIKPSRSKNTLMDLNGFRNDVNSLLAAIEKGEIDEGALVSELETKTQLAHRSYDNPHTSEFYKAIQFTCRQLIKLKNPLYNDLKELKNLTKQSVIENENLLKVLERIDLKYIQREVRFFYPYEVQIMDKKSFEENEKGRSAHSEYKRAQIHTAMKRVMGALLNAN
ncbi:MAG: TIGR04552 family protein [Deltaproteobacteria bacterium]|nr:TIGR04552 family protein [Deltaproteobacteria bacterium]